MYGILLFDLTLEEAQHKTAVEGAAWKNALWEFDRRLRAIEKHGDGDHAQKFRNILSECMADNSVSFD